MSYGLFDEVFPVLFQKYWVEAELPFLDPGLPGRFAFQIQANIGLLEWLIKETFRLPV